jgi:putative glutamine amidotransferase
MIKKIGIIPTIIERRNSLNIIIDTKLIEFIKKCFPKYQLVTLLEKQTKEKLNLILSGGGNSIISLKKNKANIFRKTLDDYYFKYSIENDIPFLGVCHGAQYIAGYYKSKIIKKKNHTRKNHIIKLSSQKKMKVNSYHDFSIVKLGKSLNNLAFTADGSIEAFKHKNKKILGIMWHPERYKKIKKFDLDFIKKHL